jgi:hypothetical protein
MWIFIRALGFVIGDKGVYLQMVRDDYQWENSSHLLPLRLHLWRTSLRTVRGDFGICNWKNRKLEGVNNKGMACSKSFSRECQC